jgi:hypothetical protein
LYTPQNIPHHTTHDIIYKVRIHVDIVVVVTIHAATSRPLESCSSDAARRALADARCADTSGPLLPPGDRFEGLPLPLAPGDRLEGLPRGLPLPPAAAPAPAPRGLPLLLTLRRPGREVPGGGTVPRPVSVRGLTSDRNLLRRDPAVGIKFATRGGPLPAPALAAAAAAGGFVALDTS